MTNLLQIELDEARLRALLADLSQRAREWRFEVAPNPCVGAALLSRGDVVASGFHRVWGGPHAEIEALAEAAKAGVNPSEVDALLVTLEPCSSQGKTGPCTQAILAAGIKRVVVGAVDPDARHRGQGIELLRQQGIEVQVLEGASPLRAAAPHFLAWTDVDRVRRPRPWLIAKWAQTRTGQLSPPPDVGQGRWITSPPALAEVQRLRARVDALVTGVGTVLADDPRLSVRPPGETQRPPWRVVLDPELRTPEQARMLRPVGPLERAGPVHIYCLAGASSVRHRALEAAGAEIHGLHPDSEGELSLREVLGDLWGLGVQRALLEAGPRLVTSFLRHGFVDQVRVYTGPVNGGQGPSLAQSLAPRSLSGRLDRECGPDNVLEAFVGLDT